MAYHLSHIMHMAKTRQVWRRVLPKYLHSKFAKRNSCLNLRRQHLFFFFFFCRGELEKCRTQIEALELERDQVLSEIDHAETEKNM